MDSKLKAYRKSPLGRARNIAGRIMMDHSVCFAEDVPLDGIAEDIAQAILAGVHDSSKQDEAKR
jgi:hypothetical protein